MTGDEFMQKLMKAAEGGDDDARSVGGKSDGEVVDILRSVFEKSVVGHDLKPGDIVRHKWPEHRDTNGGDAPMMFMRMEEFNVGPVSPNDAFNHSITRIPDCVIGTLRPNNHGLAFVTYPMSSDELEPHPDFPRPKKH